MNVRQWLKPAVIGGIIGVVALGFVGFKGAGWITAEAASRSASSRASEEVVAALPPICVIQAEPDARYPSRLAKLKGQASYEQSRMVVDTARFSLPYPLPVDAPAQRPHNHRSGPVVQLVRTRRS